MDRNFKLFLSKKGISEEKYNSMSDELQFKWGELYEKTTHGTWTEFFVGFFSGVRSLWSTDVSRASIEELRAEIRSLSALEQKVEDLHYSIAPRHTKKLQRSAVLFLSDQDDSIGVGLFISATRVITAFHIIRTHYEASSKRSFKRVTVKGRYPVEATSSELTTQNFVVVDHDAKRDLVVLDLVGGGPHHTFCELPEIGAMDKLGSTTRLVVTSFTSALAKQAPGFIDESFAVIPAQLIKITKNHCAYSSALFSGDSGGAVVLASNGDLMCIHLETVNEASEKLRTDATPKDMILSINSLVSGLSSGYIGLRLDSTATQNFIKNAK